MSVTAYAELQTQRHNIIRILSIGHSLRRCHRSNRTNVSENAVCCEFKPWMEPTRTLTWHRSETYKRRYSRFVRKVQSLLLLFFFFSVIIILCIVLTIMIMFPSTRASAVRSMSTDDSIL